ncbi:hypothetical protein BH10PSE6_BH10PSE6_49070 [soil metagenome]
MIDTAAAPGAKSTATVAPDQMAWDSRTRRLVMIYLPLALFVSCCCSRSIG